MDYSLLEIRDLNFAFIHGGKNKNPTRRFFSLRDTLEEKKDNYHRCLVRSEEKGAVCMRILHDKNLSIRAGERVGIVGGSGSGKSVTFYSVFGLYHPVLQPHAACGEIIWEGRQCSQTRARRLLGRQIAFLFQESMSSFHPGFTLDYQLHFFLSKHGISGRLKRRELIREMLEGVRIPLEKINEKPASLSGGMLQRFNIALGLLLRPRLLIADECTSALDVTTQASIISLLDELALRHKLSVFFISHNQALVDDFCTRSVQY